MLKCAFYEKEITPPLGCHLSGYGNVRHATDVKDRLMAKACVISNGEETVAFIAIDALRIFYEVREMIAERVFEYTGIPKENVIIAAVHSHTGIPDYESGGDEEALRNEAHYFDIFPKLIADCAILAYKRLEDSDMSFGIGEVEGISFCRDYIMKNSTPRTNPPRTSPDIVGPASKTDNELPVIFAKSKDGKPLGAVVTFACHLDCVGGDEFSGDFPAELSRQLKEEYGEEFVTVFFMGTAGDINHFDVSKKEDAPDHYIQMGKKIADEAKKVIESAEPIVGDEIKCKLEFIEIPRREADAEELENAKRIVATVKEIPGVKIAADGTDPEQYALMMAKRLLWFVEECPPIYNIPLHFAKIGDVSFYGFPSEIFCHFGLMVKEGCGKEKRIVASYCSGQYGYVPTRDLIYDTIYESRPGSNRMCAEAGYMMAQKLIEMGK